MAQVVRLPEGIRTRMLAVAAGCAILLIGLSALVLARQNPGDRQLFSPTVGLVIAVCAPIYFLRVRASTVVVDNDAVTLRRPLGPARVLRREDITGVRVAQRSSAARSRMTPLLTLVTGEELALTFWSTTSRKVADELSASLSAALASHPGRTGSAGSTGPVIGPSDGR